MAPASVSLHVQPLIAVTYNPMLLLRLHTALLCLTFKLLGARSDIAFGEEA
jgi:hypothetical protein